MASNQPTHQLWVANHRASAAAEFINLLSPVSGILAGPGGLPHGHLYRGVDDASHLLLPSAFRSNAKLLYLHICFLDQVEQVALKSIEK
jgi:hypothetical protein